MFSAKRIVPLVTSVEWENVADEVARLHPMLAAAINEVAPGANMPLLRLTYQYGDEILKKGVFQLPLARGATIALNDLGLEPEIQSALKYNNFTTPMLLILRGSLEKFIEVDDRVVPYQLLHAGDFLGLSTVFDVTAANQTSLLRWGLTAGARSIFMLPKISDNNCHKRLIKQLNISIKKPHNLLDHWEVFRAIGRSSLAPQPWTCEILCFTQPWVTHLTDPAWQAVRMHLLEQAWYHTQNSRHQYLWELLFARLQSQKRMQATPFIVNFVQHALMVGAGILPGLAPASNNQLAPIDVIQKAYEEIYQLKSYAAVIMQPHRLSPDSPQPNVYLSLQHVLALKFMARFSSHVNAIEDLYLINSLLADYLNVLKSTPMLPDHSNLKSFAENLQFTAIHSANNLPATLYGTRELLSLDPYFKNLMQNFPDKKIPVDTSFFKGCLRLSSGCTAG